MKIFITNKLKVMDKPLSPIKERKNKKINELVMKQKRRLKMLNHQNTRSPLHRPAERSRHTQHSWHYSSSFAGLMYSLGIC